MAERVKSDPTLIFDGADGKAKSERERHVASSLETGLLLEVDEITTAAAASEDGSKSEFTQASLLTKLFRKKHRKRTRKSSEPAKDGFLHVSLQPKTHAAQ